MHPGVWGRTRELMVILGGGLEVFAMLVGNVEALLAGCEDEQRRERKGIWIGPIAWHFWTAEFAWGGGGVNWILCTGSKGDLGNIFKDI